jgi:hypothetical protein
MVARRKHGCTVFTLSAPSGFKRKRSPSIAYDQLRGRSPEFTPAKGIAEPGGCQADDDMQEAIV